MKGYSSSELEGCALARIEGVNASYKDLAAVCDNIRGQSAVWAIEFLTAASLGMTAVRFRRHNKKLAHRRELGGAQGRYPMKAAKAVLKALKSAMANGDLKGVGPEYVVISAVANKKDRFPRMSSKGRLVRSTLETSRIELVLKGNGVPKGVEVTKPAQKAEKPTEQKKPLPKEEPHEHKNVVAKEKAAEHVKGETKPHQHGENKKR